MPKSTTRSSLNTAIPEVMNRVLRRLALLVLTGAIHGCATAPPASTDNRGLLQELDPEQTIQHAVEDPEVAAMWTSAEIARQEKNYPEAIVHIENALRRIPDDPVLWSRLAELKMRLGENVLAENYAAKSNALVTDRPGLQYRNWLIIQHSRDQRGDVLGAREAQVKARALLSE